ncbi:MAG: recombination protein O N-terminal domain-containing protein [Candidatus Spechtbacterales bacterium]
MYSAKGIILKRDDFRERDERVVLYTKEFGRISIVAKGTRRIEAKLRGNLDIFNFVDIIFVEGAHFFILTGAETRERFGSLTKNPYIYTAALSSANTVLNIFWEHLPASQAGAKDNEFFDYFYSTLNRLDEYGRHKSKLETSLYAWLILKKFQMDILENQGHLTREPSWHSKPELSKNAALLLEMLRGERHRSARLSKQEFTNIEDVFGNMFAHFFNYKIFSWIPIIQNTK